MDGSLLLSFKRYERFLHLLHTLIFKEDEICKQTSNLNNKINQYIESNINDKRKVIIYKSKFSL